MTKTDNRAIPCESSNNVYVDSLFPTPNTFPEVSNRVSEGETLQSNVNGMSDPKDKIALFMSLFKGRDDVFAKRYESKKKGTNGYLPFCLNEWKSELFGKSMIRALDKLLEHDIGVLSGTTAFGKTVVAIKLIAERKVNTLIIVDKVNLVTQWKKRLSEFLTINEILPDRVEEKKRGRKKANCTIGQLGAGKDSLSGIIDIAVMQSLNRMGEVKDCMEIMA